MSIFKNNIVVGITAGLAATILAPILIPAAKRSARPLAKALIKGGIVVYEKGREAVAHTGEMIEDVVAEIRAEDGEHHEAWDAADAHEAHSGTKHDGEGEGEPRHGVTAVGNGKSHGMQEGTA